MSDIIGVGQMSLLDLNDAIISGTPPTNPSLGALWIDESVDPQMLKKWSGNSWISVGELDPDLSETIESIEYTLGNMSNDNLINFQERQVLKDKLTEIIGYVIADSATSLPTATVLDGGGKGSFWSVRKSAINAGINSSDAGYINVETRYNNLRSYLGGLTPVKPWDTRNSNADKSISVTKSTFRDRWLQYYLAVDALAEATAQKLKQNVDDIEIGGRNLLSGTSGEWKVESLGTSYYQQFVHPEVILEVGETYTFSVVIEKVSDDEIPINVHLGTGTNSYQKDIGGWRVNNIEFGKKIVLTKTITQSDLGAHTGIFAWRVRNEQRPTTVRFKEAKLEKGNKATDWTPAPEDTDKKIDDLAGKVTNVESRVTDEAIINKVTSSEKWVTQVNTINKKVEQTDIDRSIDGVEIGGRNLLVLSETTTQNALDSFTFENDTITGRMRWYLLFNSTKGMFESNKDYTISIGDIYNPDSTDVAGVGKLRLVLYDFTKGLVIQNLGNISPNSTIKFKTNSAITNDTLFIVYISASAVTTFSITKLKLEKGNKATDWTPAPEDVEANAINASGQSLSDKTKILSGTEIYTDKADDSVVHVEMDGKSVGGGSNLLAESYESVTNNRYDMVDYNLLDSTLTTDDTVTITLKGTLGNDRSDFRAYNSGGSSPSAILTDLGNGYHRYTGKWFIPNLSNPNTFLRIYQFTSSGTSTSTIEWIKMVKGTDTSLEYEPSIPTPDYPIEIHSLNDFDVVSQKSEGGTIDGIEIGGRNLLKDGLTPSGVSISKQSDGSYKITNPSKSAWGRAVSHPIVLEPNQEYTASMEVLSRTGSYAGIGFREGSSDHGNLTFSTTKGKVSTTYKNTTSSSKTVNVWIKLYYYGTAYNKPTDNASIHIRGLQVEKGNKATDWIPAPEDILEDEQYENIDKINILLDEPLRSIGDVKDRLFRDRDGLWKVERNVGQWVLNGSESWSFEPSSKGYYTALSGKLGRDVDSNSSKQPLLSSHFKSVDVNKSVLSIGDFRIGGNTNIIINRDDGVGGIVGFKSWLSSNNVTIFAQLANQAIEILPQEFQDKLNNIASYKDSNYLYTIVDKTNILPSYVRDNLKPTLHATFKGGGWHHRFNTEQSRSQIELIGTRVNNVENEITSEGIITTITESTTFKNALDGKVDTEAIGDLATKDELNELGEGVDGKIDTAIQGIDFEPYATRLELEETSRNITAKFSATGGMNLIKNSIGFAGREFWDNVSSIVSSVQNNELDVLGFGSGFIVPHNSSYASAFQKVSVVSGQSYTLSWYENVYSRDSNGYTMMRVHDGDSTSSTIITREESRDTTEGFEYRTATFTPSSEVIYIRMGTYLAEAGFTGLMLNIGDIPLQWSLATGELYNTNIRMDINGIRVSQLDEDRREIGYTQITPEEFAGYYDSDGSGTFEKVFYLNGEETVTKKFRAEDEITMGTIKIIKIESSTRSGWAFVPTTD